jgi:hypothetical protein
MGHGMARCIRVQFEGAFYHVVARGNGRAAIFVDDQNRAFCSPPVRRFGLIRPVQAFSLPEYPERRRKKGKETIFANKAPLYQARL